MESTTAHMLRLAKNWASPTPMPTRKRTFTWNTSPGSSLWFSDLELLPGGKWALTLTGDGLRVRNLNGEVIEDGVLIARHPGRDVLGQDMVVDTRDMPRSCAVADYCASRWGSS